MNVLVFDVGTSSMRGVLYRENGARISDMQVRYQAIHKTGGMVEQNPEDWQRALYRITEYIAKAAQDTAETVDAIAMTAQRSSVIPVDIDGHPLCDAIMWQDKRNAVECSRLSVFNDRIFTISGAYVNPVFSGSKMSWIRHHQPEVYRNVFKFLNVPEYLLHIMTGEFRTDYTYGSRSNLMDIRNKRWSNELLRLFDVPEERLCELREPGSILGQTTETFSRKTGIQSGIPVISAGGDQQCGAIGQGVFNEGRVSIVTGTGAFMIAASDQVPEHLQGGVICNCASVKEKYILETNVLTCCSAFDWFCKNFYDWKEIDYEQINQELERICGTEEPCVVLPYFQGRSTPKWNPEATVLMANITLATKRRDILKAIVEGILLEINNNLEEMRKYVDINCAYISGGLTKSKVINRMQADIYGMHLYRMEDSESTALGALMVALTGTGRYQTLDEAFEIVRRHDGAEEYTYQEAIHQKYRNKQQYMNELYQKNFELQEENNE